MLLIALLIAACALPLAMRSPRALGLCVAAAGGLFTAVLLRNGGAVGGENSIIVTIGVVTAGLLIGAVVRALLMWGALAEDREIRRRLPRELPPRYR